MDQDIQNNEGIDLSDALQDSSNDIKVKDEQSQPDQVFYPGTPKMIQLVIKYSGGFIKDETPANYALIGIVVLAIVVSLLLIFGGNFGASGNKDAMEQMEQMLKIQPELIK